MTQTYINLSASIFIQNNKNFISKQPKQKLKLYFSLDLKVKFQAKCKKCFKMSFKCLYIKIYLKRAKFFSISSYNR